MEATTIAPHSEAHTGAPRILDREPLVLHNRSYSWITNRICGIVENKAEHHDAREDDGGHHERPPQQRLLVFDDAADAVRDPGVGTVVEDERLAVKDAGSTGVSVVVDGACFCG